MKQVGGIAKGLLKRIKENQVHEAYNRVSEKPKQGKMIKKVYKDLLLNIKTN